MRDDSLKWDAPLGNTRADIAGDGYRASLIQLARQTVLSGPIETCLKIATQNTAFGWPEIASGKIYALRLRRDRILSVNGPGLPDGWHNHGVAISDMTGAYAVIEVNGPRAIDLLNRGTELDTALPSGSVARQFHGFATLIYRWQSQTCYRLHVERCYLEAIWRHLQG